jgi:hypothetical protein
MRKVPLGVLLLVFCACSQGAFAQGSGTGMLFLPQSDAPAILIETTHGVKDLLESAKLKNRSNQVITGYRIGWVAVYASGREKIGLGLPVDLPLGIRPGATIDVPAQGVSMDYAKEGAINIVFFVTDVHTSGQNGTTESGIWRPAIAIIEKQALSLTKSEMRSAH